MMNKKGLFKSFVLAAVMLTVVAGCSKKEDETETNKSSESQSTEAQTNAPVSTKVNYQAPDGSFSLIFPDSSWKNTSEENGVYVFASEGLGEITVTHATGDAVGDLQIKAKEANLIKRLKKNGYDTDNIEVSDFQYDKSTGVKITSYQLNYKDTSAGIYYAVGAGQATDSEGFQVVGTVKKADDAALESVKEAVSSFQVLKELSAEAGSDTGAEDSEGGEASSGSGEERYFFDEAGNTIYTSENADGVWVDKSGMAYYFYEDGVKDDNGTKYYYDPPSYRENSSGSGTSSGSSSGEAADYYDFYDKNGNYIKTTQDENGRWVGDDGKTYTFGDDGVTDSDGNFHPY